MRGSDWRVRAVLALGFFGGAIAVGWANDIVPLQRSTSFVLQEPLMDDGIEQWQLRSATSRAEQIDAADGRPLRCTFTLPLAQFFTDPTIETMQIGLERNPATSTPEEFDGTMFFRVRFVDTTTWRPVEVEGLLAYLRKNRLTLDWRVDPMDAEGYMKIYKPTALADEEEQEMFGGVSADGGYRFRIARASGPPIREYFFSFNRIGYLDEAVFDHIDCITAMGDGPVITGVLLVENTIRMRNNQVPPSRMR